MNRRSLTRVLLVVVLIAVAVALAGCAPGENTAAGGEDAAGFWRGLWHGIIAPITFLVSLFNDNVGVYEVANNGGWYDFGFLFGASIILGGSGSGASRGRKRR